MMPVHKMLILYDTDKKMVNVVGPFDDLVTFMGMLEAAKINYNEVLERAKKQKIVMPMPGGMPPGSTPS